MVFNLAVVGGTFDHIHLGHEALLQTAKTVSRKVWVGLCGKSMLKNKPYPQSLQSYTQRKQELRKLGFTKITALTDIYGPAASSSKIEAIVCSPLSRPNAEKINAQRKKKLAIIEVPLVKAGDGQMLSSSRIRQGLINRQGFFYPQIFSQNLRLPRSLRPQLQRPFSAIVTQITHPEFGTISVGDIAVLSLLKQNIKPDLAIVDLKSRRQPIFPDLASEGLPSGLTAVNPAGTITKDAAAKLLDCLQKKQPTLLIDGEEDLLVLPAILLAPLKTTIFYGQPDQGLVKITVSETTKAKSLKFLQQFTSLKSVPKLA